MELGMGASMSQVIKASPRWQLQSSGHQLDIKAPFWEILGLWSTAKGEHKDSTPSLCPQRVFQQAPKCACEISCLPLRLLL